MISVHPSRPIANGICFDDASGFQDEIREHLTVLGLIFVTSFRNPADGRCYGGTIIAASANAAQAVADRRGLGEIVEGQLIRRITDAG
ncbi:hypothetical protein [Rhizobium sp. FKY42]|uniref:hypothetical protein n=1 Tax=Rhizobium sp. FKY42 TaxID=2562310 RepID=UPI0010BFAEDA|nr:hypothetical protein [Rhizobium sp. FKY42]